MSPPINKPVLATITHPKSDCCPTHEAGVITPEILQQWCCACQKYLKNCKEHTADDLVSYVADEMCEAISEKWYMASQTCIDALKLNAYISELGSLVLEKDGKGKCCAGFCCCQPMRLPPPPSPSPTQMRLQKRRGGATGWGSEEGVLGVVIAFEAMKQGEEDAVGGVGDNPGLGAVGEDREGGKDFGRCLKGPLPDWDTTALCGPKKLFDPTT
ncbi:hypothetical protein C8R44DRAFT_741950 [Mycena epipterygia]|nr:hypothetical protein C8R44DRAFT_741950 [Mycena epipterygia]